jgi:hypothetical protein
MKKMGLLIVGAAALVPLALQSSASADKQDGSTIGRTTAPIAATTPPAKKLPPKGTSVTKAEGTQFIA